MNPLKRPLRCSWPLKLLVLIFALAVTGAALASSLVRKASRDTIFAEICERSNLRILRSALERSKVGDLLSNRNRNFTFFAPTDAAFERVIDKKLLSCVIDRYDLARCGSLDQLLASTSLKNLLLNHAIDGRVLLGDSTQDSRFSFLGGNAFKAVKDDSGFMIGHAAVVEPNLEVVNGVLHIIDNVLGSLDPKTGRPFETTIDAETVHGALIATDAAIFNHTKREEMAEGVRVINIPGFHMNRDVVGYPDGGLANSPVLVFDPSMNTENYRSGPDERFNYPSLENVTRPAKDEDLAFMTVVQLGALIRTKQVSSVELARIFIERLKRYDNALKAVVTYTEELAHQQASAADKLLAQGTYLGPLHGIPYGLKDTMAVPGYKTTWGCKHFKDQVLAGEATPYSKLKAAGAVLIAKLATGSLAYDDIWFGGRTRNPWNIEEFSTGSSAGSAASTSAGAVPFAIGSETAGSITYPAARTGATAFRPTFGMVGRTLIMSLSESLDKIGPFCRSAEDCAIILDHLRGKDPQDLSSKDIKLKDPFSIDVKTLTVGYLQDSEMEVVNVLKEQGVRMVPFKLEYTVESAQQIINFTMDVDMLAHFDHWQRAGLDDEYEAQDQWPVELRRARLISAVDYVQAQRARHKLIVEVLDSMKGVDAFVGNATDWEKVAVGNLVGMPVVVVPAGFKSVENAPPNSPRRTTVPAGFYSRPYGDSEALAVAMAYQRVTKHHLQRPPVDDLPPDDFKLPPDDFKLPGTKV